MPIFAVRSASVARRLSSGSGVSGISQWSPRLCTGSGGTGGGPAGAASGSGGSASAARSASTSIRVAVTLPRSERVSPRPSVRSSARSPCAVVSLKPDSASCFVVPLTWPSKATDVSAGSRRCVNDASSVMSGTRSATTASISGSVVALVRLPFTEPVAPPAWAVMSSVTG